MTEYIITARVERDRPGWNTKNDGPDWKVCITYEAAKSWTRWFEDRYEFVYVRECSEPLNVTLEAVTVDDLERYLLKGE